jgi:uncharacterized membrane protein YdfJ with MMPL/SSD domain
MAAVYSTCMIQWLVRRWSWLLILALIVGALGLGYLYLQNGAEEAAQRQAQQKAPDDAAQRQAQQRAADLV